MRACPVESDDAAVVEPREDDRPQMTLGMPEDRSARRLQRRIIREEGHQLLVLHSGKDTVARGELDHHIAARVERRGVGGERRAGRRMEHGAVGGEAREVAGALDLPILLHPGHLTGLMRAEAIDRDEAGACVGDEQEPVRAAARAADAHQDTAASAAQLGSDAGREQEALPRIGGAGHLDLALRCETPGTSWSEARENGHAGEQRRAADHLAAAEVVGHRVS
jgi:hypothetical protein